jgi:glycosyltransferase involved in cell wall biosynthesis
MPTETSTRYAPLEVSVLTGGQDPHYALGLVKGLNGEGVRVDVIGSNEVDLPEFHDSPLVNFLNLRGDQGSSASFSEKALRVAKYYGRLTHYAAVAKPKVFHILWNNKFELIDRTALLLHYKLMGKKVAFTAHNVNTAARDNHDSAFNRSTLRAQYHLVDHIFVHTQKMKRELIDSFNVNEANVTVIPYGINNAVPDTALTSTEAKERLGLSGDDKAVLFFGAIAPYKGLDLLVSAFEKLLTTDQSYKLIIAGKPKPGAGDYFKSLQTRLSSEALRNRVLQRIEFIPDADTETYFKAADVAAMPYTEIFQSGILFLALSFGTPVVATDVGSFRDDVVDGQTGYLCQPNNPADLGAKIKQCFESALYRDSSVTRLQIREFVNSRHSWETVSKMTREVYGRLLSGDARKVVIDPARV